MPWRHPVAGDGSWYPKPPLAPGEARPASEYGDFELQACLSYAEVLIEREPNDSPERKRLQEWLRALLAEKDRRTAAHQAARAHADKVLGR